jgi:hypothetical protein
LELSAITQSKYQLQGKISGSYLLSKLALLRLIRDGPTLIGERVVRNIVSNVGGNDGRDVGGKIDGET